MMQRFKRASFIDNIPYEVNHAYCCTHADALVNVSSLCQLRHGRRIREVFITPTIWPLVRPFRHRSWLRQVRGAKPVSLRSRVRYRYHAAACRRAGGQFQFCRQFDGTGALDHVYDRCFATLAPLTTYAWRIRQDIQWGQI